MLTYRNWLFLFITLLCMVPCAFFAGAFSFNVFFLAPLFAIGFIARLRGQVADFFVLHFDHEELSADLNEAIEISAKIALGVHELDFKIIKFQSVEPQAFSVAGFKGERVIFLSSGLLRGVTETELREIFLKLYARLEDPKTPWVAMYTIMYFWFLPKTLLTAQTAWEFWIQMVRLSLARQILRRIPKLQPDAAQGQSYRFSAASYGDLIFLSPLFLGPKVTAEYGSLESILIRE